MSRTTESTSTAEQESAPVASVESVKRDHPAVAESLIAEGADRVDVAAAREEGVTAERERVVSLLAIEIPDSRDRVRAAIESGEGTAESLALVILKAQAEVGATSLESLQREGGAGTLPGHAADGVSGAERVNAWEKHFTRVNGAPAR